METTLILAAIITVIFIDVTSGSTALKLTEWTVPEERRPAVTLSGTGRSRPEAGGEGGLYLGATGGLLQLSRDLDLKAQYAIPRPSTSVLESRSPNDGAVRVVVPIPGGRGLLSCGGDANGTCRLHVQHDVSRSRDLLLSSFRVSSSRALAFVSLDNQTLYVTQGDGHVLSARRLNLSVAPGPLPWVLQRGEGEDLTVSEALQDQFNVTPVATFQDARHVYLLTLQPVSVASSRTGGLVSKLGRVRHADPYFMSYVEIELVCNHPLTGHRYAVAQAAATDRFYLYVGFARVGMGGGVDPSGGSILCRFARPDLELWTSKVRLDCNLGRPRITMLDWLIATSVSDSAKHCKRESSIDDTDCWSCLNGPAQQLGSSYTSRHVTAFFNTSHLVSMVMPVTVSNISYVIFGTETGVLAKVHVERPSPSASQQFMTFQLTSTSRILPSVHLDPETYDLYVLTADKVVRFPVTSCAVYGDCHSCLTSKDPVGCGWCGDHCSSKDNCTAPGAFHKSQCPPSVSSIRPTAGPTEGGTMLTIEGQFLCRHRRPAVTMGLPNNSNATCSVLPGWNRTRVTCLTPQMSTEGETEIRVETNEALTSGDWYTFRGVHISSLHFSYKRATVTSFWPTRGPQSGGTVLTVRGSNLDIGSHLRVSVAHNVSCDVTNVTASQILCTTQPATATVAVARRRRFADRAVVSGPVTVTLDHALLEVTSPASNVTFYVLPDPRVVDIQPRLAFVSGGTAVTVFGSDLDAVTSPHVDVSLSDPVDRHVLSSQACCVEAGGQRMVCLAVDISSLPGLTTSSLHPTSASLSFRLDGAGGLALQGAERALATFTYYPDPFLAPLSDPRALPQGGGSLVLQGQGLLTDLKSDVTVTLGNVSCPVSDVTPTSVICSVPELPPGDYYVKVKIGRLGFDLGFAEVPVTSSLPYYLIAVVIAAALIVVGLMTVLQRYRALCFRKKTEMTVHFVRSPPGSSPATPATLPRSGHGAQWAQAGVAMTTGVDEETLALMSKEQLLIDSQYLQLEDILGKGNFGCVYRGLLTLPDSLERRHVAVKMLHQDAPEELELRAFLQEALLMKDFHHPNVLELVGVCLGLDAMPLVVLPFMKNGDLLTYIRDENHRPTVRDLVLFAVDIARGMAYLAGLHFVHRDLAARNCILDEGMSVRVADFGLARHLAGRDYYRPRQRTAKVPVKWVALESLENGTYTSQSDVWSYGVVLWELMTRGQVPYPDVDTWDVIVYLKSGRRLQQPTCCPDVLYDLMFRCWLPEPERRPTFSQLEAAILALVQTPQHAGPSALPPEVTQTRQMPTLRYTGNPCSATAPRHM